MRGTKRFEGHRYDVHAACQKLANPLIVAQLQSLFLVRLTLVPTLGLGCATNSSLASWC